MVYLNSGDTLAEFLVDLPIFEAGVKRISTELTAGVLAARAQMGEGPPAHVGTPGQFPEQTPVTPKHPVACGGALEGDS